MSVLQGPRSNGQSGQRGLSPGVGVGVEVTLLEEEHPPEEEGDAVLSVHLRMWVSGIVLSAGGQAGIRGTTSSLGGSAGPGPGGLRGAGWEVNGTKGQPLGDEQGQLGAGIHSPHIPQAWRRREEQSWLGL